MLTTLIHGEPTALPPLLIVHGLFGSARNWSAIGKRLSAARQVVAVDLRNHGDSPHMAPHDYPALAADLAEVIAGLGGRADVLGHSMGGKAAMWLALTRPAMIRRLVVADIAPISYDHTQAPYVAAMRGLDLTGLASRGEADRRLALTVPEAPVRAFLLQSLELREGPPHWTLNLDQLAADMAAIMAFPDTGARFDGPALFLRGELSGYVPPSAHGRIRALFPAARIETVMGAGHWLHADRPREFEAEVAKFIN